MMSNVNKPYEYGAHCGDPACDDVMRQTGESGMRSKVPSGVAGGDMRPITYTHAGQSARGDGVKS